MSDHPAQDVRASRIVGLLAKAAVESLPAELMWLSTGECEGSKHHSPSPLLIRPLHLSSAMDQVLGYPAREEDDLVYLCATCRDNLIVYLSMLYAYQGSPPMAVKRDFGNSVRSLGDKAWEHWTNGTPV